MKIGVESSGVIDIYGIEDGFAILKEAGFDSVDYTMTYYFTVKEEVDEAYFEELCDRNRMLAYFDQVKAASEKYGVAVGQCHAPYPSYFAQNELKTEIVHKMIRKSIEMCAYIGAKHLVVHPVFNGSARFPTMNKEEEHAANLEFFSSLIPELKKYGVTCCLENLFAIDWGTKKAYIGSCSDLNEAVWYIDTLNEMAGEKCFAFCYDVGHGAILGIDPCYAFEKLGHRLEALHIHDNSGMTDDHTAPYLGIVNWKRFIKALRDSDYKGDLNFETFKICRAFPKELVPDVVKLISATGRYFKAQLEAEE